MKATAPTRAFVCEKHGVIEYPAWRNCWNGCDDGYFDGYEDDPLWYDEGDLEPCDVCHGKGGWKVCPQCAVENGSTDDVDF